MRSVKVPSDDERWLMVVYETVECVDYLLVFGVRWNIYRGYCKIVWSSYPCYADGDGRAEVMQLVGYFLEHPEGCSSGSLTVVTVSEYPVISPFYCVG